MPRKSTPFDPSKVRFSRTSVDVFLKCPRCFYLKMRGITAPSLPFTLNSAVDALLKAEFDQHRLNGTVPNLLEANGLSLVPANNQSLGVLVGSRPKVTTEYKGFTFEGSLDDVWLDQTQTGYVVDYKATAKKDPVIALDLTTPHHQSYVNQVAFYVWLLRQGGHSISDTCYFVYATGDNTQPAFEDTMRFRTYLIAHQVDCSWIPAVLDQLLDCHHQPHPPAAHEKCALCAYVLKYNHLCLVPHALL